MAAANVSDPGQDWARAQSRANGAFFVDAEDAFFSHLPEAKPAEIARYCASGHKKGATMKFCDECGKPLTSRAAPPPPGRTYDPDLAQTYLNGLLAEAPALAPKFAAALGRPVA